MSHPDEPPPWKVYSPRLTAPLYFPDAQIAAWNAQIARPRPGCDCAADEALSIILDERLAQVIGDIDGSGVTLLTDPTGKQCAVLVDNAGNATFSNDPWYWEGLTYRPREAS
jgi:hypothetical protein